MLTDYAKHLIERKAALKGQVTRQVSIVSHEKQARLTAYAGSIINRHSDRHSDRKVLLNADIQSGLNNALRDAGKMLQERDQNASQVKAKRLQAVYYVRLRNRFTGKVRTIRTKAIDEQGAKRQVKRRIKKFETLVDCVEKRFAIQ